MYVLDEYDAEFTNSVVTEDEDGEELSSMESRTTYDETSGSPNDSTAHTLPIAFPLPEVLDTPLSVFYGAGPGLPTAGTPSTASGPLENGGHWERTDNGLNWSYKEFNAAGNLTFSEAGRYGRTPEEAVTAGQHAPLAAQHPADLPIGEDLDEITADKVLSPANPNDIDGDGTPNHEDPDIDGDGIRNHDDANPYVHAHHQRGLRAQAGYKYGLEQFPPTQAFSSVPDPDMGGSAEHTSGARESVRNDHEEAKARKARERAEALARKAEQMRPSQIQKSVKGDLDSVIGQLEERNRTLRRRIDSNPMNTALQEEYASNKKSIDVLKDVHKNVQRGGAINFPDGTPDTRAFDDVNEVTKRLLRGRGWVMTARGIAVLDVAQAVLDVAQEAVGPPGVSGYPGYTVFNGVYHWKDDSGTFSIGVKGIFFKEALKLYKDEAGKIIRRESITKQLVDELLEQRRRDWGYYRFNIWKWEYEFVPGRYRTEPLIITLPAGSTA